MSSLQIDFDYYDVYAATEVSQADKDAYCGLDCTKTGEGYDACCSKKGCLGCSCQSAYKKIAPWSDCAQYKVAAPQVKVSNRDNNTNKVSPRTESPIPFIPPAGSSGAKLVPPKEVRFTASGQQKPSLPKEDPCAGFSEGATRDACLSAHGIIPQAGTTQTSVGTPPPEFGTHELPPPPRTTWSSLGQPIRKKKSDKKKDGGGSSSKQKSKMRPAKCEGFDPQSETYKQCIQGVSTLFKGPTPVGGPGGTIGTGGEIHDTRSNAPKQKDIPDFSNMAGPADRRPSSSSGGGGSSGSGGGGGGGGGSGSSGSGSMHGWGTLIVAGLILYFLFGGKKRRR